MVTGAGSGIGRSIAVKFAEAGAAVRILDRNNKQADVVAAEISSVGGTSSVHTCDVTDQSGVKACFNEIAQLGRIDILVNNAGISHIGNVESTAEEDFEPRHASQRQGIL